MSDEPQLTAFQRFIRVQNAVMTGKGRRNGQVKYRNFDDVVKALKGPALENHILFIPSVVMEYREGPDRMIPRDRQGQMMFDANEQITTLEVSGWYWAVATVKVFDALSKTNALLTQGQFEVRVDTQFRGMSPGQQCGTAGAYALKYAMQALLLISDAEDLDAVERDDTERTNTVTPQNTKAGAMTGEWRIPAFTGSHPGTYAIMFGKYRKNGNGTLVRTLTAAARHSFLTWAEATKVSGAALRAAAAVKAYDESQRAVPQTIDKKTETPTEPKSPPPGPINEDDVPF